MNSKLIPVDSDPDLQSNSKGTDTRPQYKKKSWTIEEDLKLRNYVQTYGEANWKHISKYISGRNTKQCHNRKTFNICMNY